MKDVFVLFEVLSTVYFAYKGAHQTLVHDGSWLLAIVLALVNSIGGSTVRDLVLVGKPFWVDESDYVTLCVGCALLAIFANARPSRDA